MSRNVKPVESEDTNHPTRSTPLVLRVLIFGFLGFILIAILAGYILVRNIDDVLLARIEREFGAEAEISGFSFNPVRGFSLEGFSMLFPGDSTVQSIDELQLLYSFPALFKKEIRITGIEMTAPLLYLSQNYEGQWNILSWIGADSLKTTSDTLSKAFPTKFSIKRASIRNIKCILNAPKVQMNIAEGNIEAKNIHFNSMDDFHAEFEFDKIKGIIDAADLGWKLSFETEGISVLNHDSGDFQIAASIGLTSSDVVLPEFDFWSKGRINMDSLFINIDSMQCESHNKSGFRVSGSGAVIELSSNPIFDLSLIIDEFNYLKDGWIQKTVHHFFPSIPNFNLKLDEPTKLRIEGVIPITSSDFNINCNLEHSSLIDDLVLNRYGISADDISLKIKADLAYFTDSLRIDSLCFDFDAAEAVVHYEPLPEFEITNFIGSIILAESEGEGRSNFSGSNGGSAAISMVFKLPSNLLEGSFSIEYLDSLIISIRNAAPADYGISQIEGGVDALIKFWNHNGLCFDAELIALDTLKWLNESEAVPIPIDTLASGGLITIGDDLTNVLVEYLNIDLSKWLKLTLSAEINQESAEIIIDTIRLDLVEAQKFYPHLFPGELDVKVEAAGASALSVRNPLHNYSADFNARLFAEIISLDSIKAEDITGDINCSITDLTSNLNAEFEMKRAFVSSVRSRQISDVKVMLEAMVNFSPFSLSFSSNAVLPSESMNINLSGDSRMRDSRLEMDLQLTSAFADTNWVEVLPELKIMGKMDYNASISIDSLGLIEGEVSFDDFGVLTPHIEIAGVGGRVPLQQTLQIKPFSLVEAGGADNPFYCESRPYLVYSSNLVDNIKADRLNLLDRDMFDISSDVFWEEGYFQIPHFQVSLFEGNLVGNCWMKADSLLSGEILYEISAQGAEINSDLVSQLDSKSGKSGSRISFNLNFKGTQISPSDPDFDLEGYLHITKISPKVAENLLLILDPQQQDKGIQSTLYFLKRGWGIRSFSFQASHGFVYSTIITQQPSIKEPFPFLVSKILPLEKEIKLTRLPLKLFLAR